MTAPERTVEELIERYASLVRGTVAKVMGRRDEAVADEVLQRVSEALWKQVKQAQPIEHPTSYLYRCAVRETVRILQREVERGELPLDHAADIHTEALDPGQALEARELATTTETMIAELAPDRAAAVRAHIAGFTVEEIMAMNGWRYQKARNLIARGIAELRLRLRERGVV